MSESLAQFLTFLLIFVTLLIVWSLVFYNFSNVVWISFETSSMKKQRSVRSLRTAQPVIWCLNVHLISCLKTHHYLTKYFSSEKHLMSGLKTQNIWYDSHLRKTSAQGWVREGCASVVCNTVGLCFWANVLRHQTVTQMPFSYW